MSLTQQAMQKPINPAKRFLEFRGSENIFRYWDKDKEKNIEFPLKDFIVLDELTTVTGFCKEFKKPIWANEVHNQQTMPLSVRIKGQELGNGLYSDIKDSIKAKGGKYCKSVYIYTKGDIYNLQLSGAPVSAWIEKDIDVKNAAVKLGTSVKETNGANAYFKPVFESKAFDPKQLKKAQDADRELQNYFKEYYEWINSFSDAVEMDTTRHDLAEGSLSEAADEAQAILNAQDKADNVEPSSHPF